MTFPVTVALIALAGWSVTGLLGGTRNELERGGLALILGAATLTVIMFGVGLVGLPIRPIVYLPILGLVALDGLRRLRRDDPTDGPTMRELVLPHHPVIAWPVIVLVVVLLAIIFARCAYLPNRLYDSITSFDLLGKTIAAEGVFRVSLFDYTPIARGGSYPPFTALTFAWGYATGLSTAGQALILPLTGFFIWLFGFARRFVGPTTAWGLLLLALLTPDLYSFIQLPLTNMAVTVFVALTLLYFFAGMSERGGQEIRISAISAALIVWSRADGVAFVLGAWMVLIGWRPGPVSLWRRLLYGVPAVAVLLGWQLFAETTLGGGGAGRFTSSIFWDGTRLGILIEEAALFLFHINSMGVVVWAFGLALLSYIVFRRGRTAGAGPLYLAIGLSLVVYLAIYYQIDPIRQDPLPALMRSSFRRGITALVVPMWFGILMSPIGGFVRRDLGTRFSRRRPISDASPASP